MVGRPLKVKPMLLLGLITILVLSAAILASAKSGEVPVVGKALNLAGGTASDALAAGEAQMGKPFEMSTDGPNSFSCSGLMRYILRTTGVDGDAPWSPEGYLSKYPHVDPADLQPGDIVIYPNWATMYAGNGMLLDANEMEGVVTHTPMDVAGVPEGIVRPYSQSSPSPAPQPAAPDQTAAPDLPAEPSSGSLQYSMDQPSDSLLDTATQPPVPDQPIDQPIDVPAQQPAPDQAIPDPLMQ